VNRVWDGILYILKVRVKLYEIAAETIVLFTLSPLYKYDPHCTLTV
jgi:hypothetical protein